MRQLFAGTLSVLLLGCGGESMTVVFKSPQQETMQFGVVDSRGVHLWAGGVEGVLSLPFASTDTSKNLGKNPTITLYLTERIIGTNTEARRWGVGPFVSSANWTSDTSESKQLAVSVFVDEWSFTGDPIRPFAIKAHSLPLAVAPAGPNPIVIEIPSLLARSKCDTGNDGEMFCGGTTIPEYPEFTAKLGQLGGAAGCPDEVVKLFVGAGTGASAKFRFPSSINVDGASGSFSCVQNKLNVACGANGSVPSASVNGCTWRAFAVGAPRYRGPKKGEIYFWVGATTNDGCTAGKLACNSEWLATE